MAFQSSPRGLQRYLYGCKYSECTVKVSYYVYIDYGGSMGLPYHLTLTSLPIRLTNTAQVLTLRPNAVKLQNYSITTSRRFLIGQENNQMKIDQSQNVVWRSNFEVRRDWSLDRSCCKIWEHCWYANLCIVWFLFHWWSKDTDIVVFPPFFQDEYNLNPGLEWEDEFTGRFQFRTLKQSLWN